MFFTRVIMGIKSSTPELELKNPLGYIKNQQKKGGKRKHMNEIHVN